MAKLDTRKRGVDNAMPSAAIVARLDISERCADNVRNLLASQVPRAAVARALAKAARAVETQTSAVVVDRSVIDDLIALVETRVAAYVAEVLKRMAKRETPRPGQEWPPLCRRCAANQDCWGETLSVTHLVPCPIPHGAVGGWTRARVEWTLFPPVERLCPCERLSVL